MKVAQKVREAVYDRDGWACVWCGASSPLTLQHRVPRGAGGTKLAASNSPANLVTLCGSGTTGCHGKVESNRLAAIEEGLIVRRGTDPATVPVFYARTGEWFLLRIEGHLQVVPPC